MNVVHWQLIGWTMLHFLWIGSLVALAILVMRLALRRAGPNVRYTTTLLGFAILAMAPLVIAGWLLASGEFAPQPSTMVVTRTAEPAALVEMPSVAMTPANEEVIDLKYNPIELPVEAPAEPPPASVELAVEPTPESIATPNTEVKQRAQWDPLALLEAITNYLPWLWLVGTPLTFLLLATGLVGSERMRRQATVLTEGAVYEAAERLRASLGIARQVTIAVSDRVLQPVLLGIVRPLVLLPSAAVTGWTPAELEMALVHELAHVRRWDNLVNFVQRVVESLLFFHPAVWLVSRWLREGREQCCDAVVVAQCGDREGYAELLLSVARDAHNERLPSMAVALTQHPLARRIRRILQLEDDPMLVSKRTLLFVAALFVAITTAAFWTNSSADETVGEPEALNPAAEEAAPGETPDETAATRDEVELAQDVPAVAVIHFVQDRSKKVDANERAAWLEEQKALATSREVVDRALQELHKRSVAGDNSASNITESWLMEQLEVTTDDGVLRIQLDGESPDSPDPVQRSEAVNAIAKSYLWHRRPEGAEGSLNVELHSDLSEDALDKARAELRRAGKNYEVSIDGDFVGLRAERKIYVGFKYLIVDDAITSLADADKLARAGQKKAEANNEKEATESAESESESTTEIDTTISGTSKTYHFTDDTPHTELAKVIGAHRKAGHHIQIKSNNGAVLVVVKPNVDASILPDSPFPSLEDQRIADLAYGMFGAEVSQIDDDEVAAAVKAKGFRGGVVLSLDRRDQRGQISSAGFLEGDILVGLHVWPTSNLEQLGEVLRRDDLHEFNPLKYYVLRQEVDPKWQEEQYRKAQEAERKREQEREEAGRGGFDEGFGGRGGGMRGRGGGEFGGGYGGGRGRGGMGRGMGMEDETVEVEIPYVWKLHTGRVRFDSSAWRDEQDRMKIAAAKEAPKALPAPVVPAPAVAAVVPATPPSKPSQPKLLYDGKTFDQWRESFETELKVENRAEAIKALRAFGRAGYAKEAAETILEVAEEYDMLFIGSERTAVGALQTAIAYSFVDVNQSNPLPTEVAYPILLEWYREKPADDRLRLTEWILSHSYIRDATLLGEVAKLTADGPVGIRQAALSCLVNSDRKIESELTQQAIGEMLTDSDRQVVIHALRMLTSPADKRPNMNGWGFELPTLTPEMLALLFDKDPMLQQAARRALSKGSAEQLKPVVSLLTAVLKDPRADHRWQTTKLYEVENDSQHQVELAALRALAATQEYGKPAISELTSWLEKDDDDLKIAACTAIFLAHGVSGNLDNIGRVPKKVQREILTQFSVPLDDENIDIDAYENLGKKYGAELEELFIPDPYSGGFGGGGAF
ncbi:M56 family metallopeptidase [Aeoliella sp.]|uniref:M56 family metallopeptidase n=1 Tax=Aeoliella sp. TaxID=2795800 RepID=UPI003CCB917A